MPNNDDQKLLTSLDCQIGDILFLKGGKSAYLIKPSLQDALANANVSQKKSIIEWSTLQPYGPAGYGLHFNYVSKDQAGVLLGRLSSQDGLLTFHIIFADDEPRLFSSTEGISLMREELKLQPEVEFDESYFLNQGS